MPSKAVQYQVRFQNGCIYTVMGHSVRGAARVFCLGSADSDKYSVSPGDRFAVRLRLGGGGWQYFVRTKRGIRALGVD